MEYTEQELNLMEGLEDLPKKPCKVCKKIFPVSVVFFYAEKRQKDGFENKCRVCRGGNYRTGITKKGSTCIDESLKHLSIEEAYENFRVNNTLPYQSFILDNHMYIFYYMIEKENVDTNTLNTIDRKWFQDRRLYSSLLRLYNGSIFKFIDAAYPNKFNAWDFITVGRKYWKVRENRVEAIKWLIDQILDDGTLESIDDIPKIVTLTLFNDRSIGMLLNYYDSLHDAIEEIYPNKFYIWQYNNNAESFYDSKENRIRCLKELVHNYLKLDVSDIPKVLSYEYFNQCYHDKYLMRFKYILDRYYDSLYDYVDEVFPGVFDKRDLPYKNGYSTLDNIKVRSEPERAIHHYLMELGINYKYGDYVGRMKLNGVNVLPDWYIYKGDKIVLVEYYGMLDMNNVDFGYNDKYEKKEKLYKELCELDNTYEYMAVYKEDLENGFTGFKDKLIKYNII
ncbi:hypothetical protein [Bacillus sp. AG4(2022)]|uniref:hypothetical protein n=1 Tax=Bacillus sp. AG4(2022) TaxID=2962594 RepID=UPI0028820F6A|nr:hypothetical protein [Bacillus sp. AG4(2022)]MDT0160308.1 hypothetical protein [Bacillus sp. AG4(2022)]